MENRRKFRLADVILSVICVVFVAEAAAPVASIGNSQYFWWLFMIAAFLLPYGLIASELGTAFPGDGGLYDWIQTAYPGTHWGARASWYYWINFPLWMASLAVVCPELLEVIFGGRIDPVWSLVIQLAFIWIVTWIAAYPVCDSILILNLSAAIKILLALTVGVLGIVYVSKNGFVNSMEARTFLPSFDLNSLSYISVILFNFLGFEVVCTYADNMQEPRRQIPQAIVTGGIVIAAAHGNGRAGRAAGAAQHGKRGNQHQNGGKQANARQRGCADLRHMADIDAVHNVIQQVYHLRHHRRQCQLGQQLGNAAAPHIPVLRCSHNQSTSCVFVVKKVEQFPAPLIVLKEWVPD